MTTAPLAFRTLQRRLTSPRDAANNEYGWFEILGPNVRRLSEAEVTDLMDNHPGETWTTTFADGTTQTYLVKMEERGLRVPGCEWSAPTTMTALYYAMFYYHRERLAKVTDPSGWSPDLLRLRYVSGEVVRTVSHSYYKAEIDEERDVLGSKLDSGRSLSGWTFSMGSMRHMENVREAEGVEKYYNLSDEDRETAASLSYRATLAILRFFKSYPIRSYVWKGAARETPLAAVEMQINDGPWCVIGPKGLPLTQG